MKLYPDPRERKVLETGEEIGSGGEGTTYKVLGDPGTVIKVFKDGAAHDREAKLRELVRSAPPTSPDGRPRYAWPTHLLYDDTGRFTGYAMPQAEGVPLDTYIYPNPGDGKFVERRFRVTLAREVSAIVAELHRHELGIVLGDVSHANFLADRTGRVTLIDIDSVQLTTRGGKTYLCPTRTKDYTAPELVGGDLGKEVRGPEQDLFVLGVLNHELLRDGWHPFAACDGRSHEARIEAGDCPLIKCGAGAPPTAPSIGDLPTELQALLRRTFVDGCVKPKLRPSGDAWCRPLFCYEKALGKVKAVPPPPVPQHPVTGTPAPWRGWLREGVLAFGVTVALLLGPYVLGVLGRGGGGQTGGEGEGGRVQVASVQGVRERGAGVKRAPTRQGEFHAAADDTHRSRSSDEPPRKRPLLLEWIMDNGDVLDRFSSESGELSESKSLSGEGER